MKNKGLLSKGFLKWVETVHTSIGLWGLQLIKSEKQPEMPKKSFTGRGDKPTRYFVA